MPYHWSVLHLLAAAHLLALRVFLLGLDVLLLHLLLSPLLLLALLAAAVLVPPLLLVLLVPRLFLLLVGRQRGRLLLHVLLCWYLLLAVELGRQELGDFGQLVLVVLLLAQHLLRLLLQLLDAHGLLPLLEDLPVVGVDQVGKGVDRQRIQVFRSAPPALVILVHLFVEQGLVLLRRQRVYVRQELSDFLDVVEGCFRPDGDVDIAVVLDEHVGEPAVVDDVDLGPAEVEAVEAAVIETFEVLLL